MDELQGDLRPAAVTGAAVAVLGTLGGLAPALVHALTTAEGAGAFAWVLGTDLAVVAAIGAGQGLLAGAAALWRGRRGHIGVQRGLGAAAVLGLFDAALYFVQMAVPATELGWAADLAILGAAGAAAGWAAVRRPVPAPLGA